MRLTIHGVRQPRIKILPRFMVDYTVSYLSIYGKSIHGNRGTFPVDDKTTRSGAIQTVYDWVTSITGHEVEVVDEEKPDDERDYRGETYA